MELREELILHTLSQHFIKEFLQNDKMTQSFLISSNLKPLVSLQDIIWLQYEVPDRVEAMRK